MDFSKLTTIESILTCENKLNAAIVKRKDFKQYAPIYLKVMNDTTCLDIFPNIRFNERVSFIKDNLQIQHCRACGKPFIYFSCSMKRYAFCSHKQNLVVNRHQLAESIKQKKLDNFNELMKNEYLILSDLDFKNTLNVMSNHYENYAYCLSLKNNAFYHDCILKTRSFIPFDENDYRIGERIYCLLNNITSIPVCKYCGKPTYYMNRKIGYAESCTACSALKNNDTRYAVHSAQFNKLIDKTKYEIVHLPYTLNSDKLEVRCKKCGTVTSLYVNNGRMFNADLMSHLCKRCYHLSSNDEEVLFEYISSLYNGKILHGVGARKIIPPKELDIYVPDQKLAFEYNGVYWHSYARAARNNNEHTSSINYAKIRHIEKMNMCIAKNIDLVQIFEDQWKTKNVVIKSKIALLMDSDNISKLEISINNEYHIAYLSLEDAYEFAKYYSLYDVNMYDIGVKYCGLYHNNELIALIGFKQCTKRIWEIVNYCQKNFNNYVNCYSLIMNRFKDDTLCTKFKIRIDRCWPVEKWILDKFKFIKNTKPNQIFVKNLKRINMSLVNKEQCLRYLKSFDEDINLSKSIVWNFRKQHFNEIYDCGFSIYETL